MNDIISIAIDGPSGAGKSSLAKSLSELINGVYLDTGALYRTVALYFLNNGLDCKNKADLDEGLKHVDLSVKYINGVQHVYTEKNDVTAEIRSPKLSMAASEISALPEVRDYLLPVQRDTSKHINTVLDGRDVGTVVLPDATVKIYLTATPKARAMRRYLEYIDKDISCTFEGILADIIKRDKNDSTRKVAPLRMASDAVLLDNSTLEPRETLNEALSILRAKIGELK